MSYSEYTVHIRGFRKRDFRTLIKISSNQFNVYSISQDNTKKVAYYEILFLFIEPFTEFLSLLHTRNHFPGFLSH